jgi:hypothetical protein
MTTTRGADDRAPLPPQTGSGGGPSTDGALRPVSVRIHPLTRFARTDDGQTELVCHVELKDRFQQSVKGLGLLRFELYRPGDGSGQGGGEVQECIWSVDLSDPGTNAAAYDDLVTRTYTVRLGSLPESIQRWLIEAEAGGQSAGWLTLRAYFSPSEPGGRPQVLTAAQRLQR